MVIKSLDIVNFRNYSKASISFDNCINIFIGNNGAGKTNILESIYFLAITKSHRTNLEKSMIKEGNNFLKIRGVSDNNKYELLLNLKGKSVSINGKPVRKISEYISNFRVILFCPSDLELISGSPAVRRRYLNIEIGQLHKEYVKVLGEYNIILKNKNEYLKSIRIDNYDKVYLDVINKQLIEKSLLIYKYRFDFLKRLQEKMSVLYKNVKIQYINNIGISEYDEEKIRQMLLKKYNENINREIILGCTQYGPNKDDYSILLNDKNIKEYGSQGQQRLMVLNLKISELEIFKEVTKEYPILLLDDVFSELDLNSRKKIIKLIDNKTQVFITSTDILNIDNDLLKNAKIFKIDSGVINQ